jgi:hypothetical protein
MIESKAEYDHDKAEAKAIRDRVDEAFDNERPECKDWRTEKGLPEHCY